MGTVQPWSSWLQDAAGAKSLQGETGQVHRKETCWSLLNMEKPPLMEKALELHAVRSFKEYAVETWLGDCSVVSFIPSIHHNLLWPLLKAGGLAGWTFSPVPVSRSELWTGRQLPQRPWSRAATMVLEVHGGASLG